MSSKTPRNLVASVTQRLLNAAQATDTDFQLVLVRYGLERLMYRLSLSPHAHLFTVNATKRTVPQAARMLGIGETKMREIIGRGRIPVVNVLGKVLVLDRDLEALLQSNYGTLKAVPRRQRTATLPTHIRDSELLKRKAR